MKAIEKLTKARIKLQSKNPFFSYLSLFIEFKEDTKKELPKWAGMCIDEKGELVFSKKFVEGLSESEIISALTHEILHLSLLHLLRLGNKDRQGWNIACDLVVNYILRENGFSLPNDWLIPNYNNEFVIAKMLIKDIDKKTAEMIYDELPRSFKQNNEGNYVIDNCKGFDEHKKSEGLTKEQKEKIKEDWEGKISEAYINAKQRGKLPKGMERLIGKLHKEKFDWKTLLRRYLTNEIPFNHSWLRRSKKSISAGYYMPDIVKEKIKVAIGIDTSGSIGQEELIDFLSEIIGMAKAHKDKIDMVLYSHDCEIQSEYEIKNGNIDKIMKMKLKGGGGTSHIPIIEKINKDLRDCKVCVFFTDGYSDINQIDFNKNKFKSIFVISKNGSDNQLKGKNVVSVKVR